MKDSILQDPLAAICPQCNDAIRLDEYGILDTFLRSVEIVHVKCKCGPRKAMRMLLPDAPEDIEARAYFGIIKRTIDFVVDLFEFVGNGQEGD